ncbi:MAG TPA: lysoplasmalogenase family protein, partial [Cryomorphaceae bacterium]|nr:lysoplasmalogenase family protein [Cryomorphaceae bacterium]
MNRYSLFSLFYFLILAVHIFAGEQHYEMIATVSKPAILSSLIVFFILNILKNKKSSFGILILAGLCFSLVGDFLLIFQETPIYFTLGLG